MTFLKLLCGAGKTRTFYPLSQRSVDQALYQLIIIKG